MPTPPPQHTTVPLRRPTSVAFPSGPTRSVRGIAGLERAYFSGGMPYGLYHEGYGTSVYVGLRYSER